MRKKMKRFPGWLLGLVLVFSCFRFLPLLALDPHKNIGNYIHHSWSTRDGLPQDTINSITQDHQGYIWIGAGKGLARFDGREFKIFNKANTPALKNDSITSLFIAGDSTMWIGTYGGGITLYKENHFFSPAGGNTLPNYFIQSITEDKEQNTWIGSTGGGIICFKDNTFSALTTEHGLSSNLVSCVLADKNGKLWIGAANGLNCLDHGDFIVYTTADGLLDDNIKTIFEDSKGNLWVGTPRGMNIIKNRMGDFPKGRISSLTTKDGLSDNSIRGVLEDRHGSTWIATGHGLNRLKRDTRDARNTSGVEQFTAQDGLSDNSLECLYEDKWGNLWIGTSAGGLNVLRDGKFTFYTGRDGLACDSVKAIYEDHAGALWIGTDGAGLNRYMEGTFTLYTEKDGLNSNNIDSLYGDRSGNLWIGTDEGLNRLDKNGFTSFSSKEGLANPTVKVLFCDGKGDLWIGTFGGGLNRLRNGKFEVFNQGHGLSNNFVLAINEDPNGFLWVGTANGLNRFKDGRFEVFTMKDGLSGDMIMDIYIDASGVPWVATNGGGLNRFKDGKFCKFAAESGGFSNHVIYRIIEDSHHNFWMSSNEGIFSVSRIALNRYAGGKIGSFQVYHFREEDGLKTSVCSGGFQPAGWKTKDGKIWFPTLKGIAMIDLSKPSFRASELPGVIDIDKDSTPVPSVSHVVVVLEQTVLIDKVTVDDVPVDMNNNLLPANPKKIEFQFKRLNYTAPDRVVFKYRLIGYDDQWRDIGSGTNAVYRNIPPGNYVFRVLGQNSYGDWMSRGDSYSFYIETPFLGSLWFYFLVTLALALAALGIPKLLEKRARRQQEEAEKYKSSSLSVKQSDLYLKKLLDLMEVEKLFMDPNLSLGALAQQVGCTKENLSQVINEQTGLNFNNFLNKYRVAEAGKKLADPKENQFVIMKIAFDVGFNSKSVFNAAFKKFTGLSPSEYREKVQRGTD
jgi:ligand-binding sensor domain-containing protein/AraC-like DNA-binding protein